MVPDISVVIPSYNQSKTIRACLDSVIGQKTKLKYEVIVVDSSDDKITSRIITDYLPKIKLIRLRKRTYPGGARTVGVKMAQGNIIATTDTDCVVNHNWLNSIYRAHEKYDVVGGKILNGNPRNMPGQALFFMEFGEFSYGTRRIVSHIPTCNISYKKWIFDKYGYFSATMRTSSDRVFNRSIKEKILFTPDVVIKHINKTNPLIIFRYAFTLGYGIALARKRSFAPGGFSLKYKFLIPFLFIHRFLKFAYRAAQARQFPIFLLTSPITLACLLSWNLGFLKCSFSHQGGAI